MSRNTQKLQPKSEKASAPKIRRPRYKLNLPNKTASATASDAIAPQIEPRDSIIASTGETKLNKTDTVVRLLCSERGATIPDIMDATGWQAHSVRGFLSGTVRKKLALNLISEVTGDGIRRRGFHHENYR